MAPCENILKAGCKSEARLQSCCHARHLCSSNQFTYICGRMLLGFAVLERGDTSTDSQGCFLPCSEGCMHRLSHASACCLRTLKCASRCYMTALKYGISKPAGDTSLLFLFGHNAHAIAVQRRLKWKGEWVFEVCNQGYRW